MEEAEGSALEAHELVALRLFLGALLELVMHVKQASTAAGACARRPPPVHRCALTCFFLLFLSFLAFLAFLALRALRSGEAAEVVAVRVWTGPMAVKYNAVLTAGALARRAHVRSNKYTTRLHVRVAALHKLAHRARLSMCTPLTRLEFAPPPSTSPSTTAIYYTRPSDEWRLVAGAQVYMYALRLPPPSSASALIGP